jgi:hypothetical protein
MLTDDRLSSLAAVDDDRKRTALVLFWLFADNLLDDDAYSDAVVALTTPQGEPTVAS